MSASLVGSEMCIRDRGKPRSERPEREVREPVVLLAPPRAVTPANGGWGSCLLYTSDAADDM
eukprot:10389820-Alexandrium_andersonii.AAC.1